MNAVSGGFNMPRAPHRDMIVSTKNLTQNTIKARLSLRMKIMLAVMSGIVAAMITVTIIGEAAPLAPQSGSCLNAPTQVVSDPSGDQGIQNPTQLDIQSVSVGEDYQYIDSARMV